MDDYIRREDVKKLLWERISLATFMRRGIPNAMNSLNLISEELEKIPAADVWPVIPAFWQDGNKSIKNPEGHAFNWWCSNCGTPQHTPVAKTLAEFTVDNPYCHKCGATMVRSFENG